MNNRLLVILALFAGLIVGVWASESTHEHTTTTSTSDHMTNSTTTDLAQRVDDLTAKKTRLEQEIKELEAAKTKAAAPHKYSVHKVGNEVWRFDEISGKMCRLLAPEATWKRAGYGDLCKD